MLQISIRFLARLPLSFFQGYHHYWAFCGESKGVCPYPTPSLKRLFDCRLHDVFWDIKVRSVTSQEQII